MKNKKNRQPGGFLQDHGPATCCLVMPYSKYPGSDSADKGVRHLGFTDIRSAKDSKGKLHVETSEGAGIRGYLVVSSKTEDYSVHEVVLTCPRRKLEFERYTYDEKTKESKFEGKVRVSLVRGPCLVSVPSARCNCPSCGTIVRTVKDVLFANTVNKEIETEINGKNMKRTVAVYKGDEKTVIKGLKDLTDMDVECPRCHQQLKWISAQRWRLSDRDLVWSSTWESMIKDSIKMEQLSDTPKKFSMIAPLIIDISREKKGEPVPFDVEGVDPSIMAINRIQTQNPQLNVCLYETALDSGRVDDVCVAVQEFSAFSVNDAQDLRNLSFGDPKKPLHYWCRIGFVPRDIRKEAPKAGGITVGEVFRLQGLDDFSSPDGED